uniref:ORF2/4 protein n=1 Tax=Torque teno virus (isolate Human/Japan/TRM1/1999) TaxID=486275 RepID=ORF24_TTVV2|nr:RecName: Full=ORF2/4 protein [Torque teno virus Human/Japan/TRM1/1999]
MWTPPRNDQQYLNWQWYSSILSSHAAMCGCPDAVAHFNHLASVLRAPQNPPPPGPQRNLPLRRLPALPAAPEAPGDRAPWPMAGGAEGEDGGAGGDADHGGAAGGPEDADLLDAVAAAETRPQETQEGHRGVPLQPRRGAKRKLTFPPSQAPQTSPPVGRLAAGGKRVAKLRGRDADRLPAAQAAAAATANPGSQTQTPVQPSPKNPPKSRYQPYLVTKGGGSSILISNSTINMFGDPKPYNPSSNDWKEEYEACRIWDRPPRGNLRDPPFYPWAPKENQYRVNFKLGFQ